MASGWVLLGLQAMLDDLCSFNSSESVIPRDVADGYRWRIETMYRDLLAQEVVDGLQPLEQEALEYLNQA